MYEDIRLAFVTYDKTKSLCGIEPLDLAVHDNQRFLVF
jgi:hypothetical protein